MEEKTTFEQMVDIEIEYYRNIYQIFLDYTKKNNKDYLYAQQICHKSINIYYSIYRNDDIYLAHKNYIMKMLIAISFLQVFEDEFEMTKILDSLGYVTKETMVIINIVKCLLISKEIEKQNRKNWLELLGDENLFIRDIISDANKLEMLSISAIDDYILYLKTNNIYNEKKVARYYKKMLKISKLITFEVVKKQADILINEAEQYISKL